jgi:hypothetical protein
MARIERPSYYDAPDDDCPRCGWGPIGCNEEETGCVAVRAVYESEFDTRPVMVVVDLDDMTDPEERPFD